MERFFGRTLREDQGEWLSVSDLMAGLMVIFLFIAIVYLRDVVAENERMEDIARTSQNREQAICQKLRDEFEKDLEEWGAQIGDEVSSCSLIIRFKSPDVLFETGSAELRPKFKKILEDFFPRYVKVLASFKESIEEVRIEGHTSSIWNDITSPEEAYFLNMKLSQERTREVLRYSLEHTEVAKERPWLQPRLTANGLSSSRLILDQDGNEDREKSRRVDFRILTDTRTEILRILEESQ